MSPSKSSPIAKTTPKSINFTITISHELTFEEWRDTYYKGKPENAEKAWLNFIGEVASDPRGPEVDLTDDFVNNFDMEDEVAEFVEANLAEEDEEDEEDSE